MDVVVVGVDGSGNSREALRVAVIEAAWRNAKVHAVHAVKYPASFGIYSVAIDLDVIQDAGRAVLDEELERLKAEYPDGLPVPIESSVPTGHAGIALQSVNSDSEEDKTVLTVVGSRGLGGVAGPILGSVTTYLVHHLSGPLLVVPLSDADAGRAGLLAAEVMT